MTALPRLLVVTGRPATGKTTLARVLCEALGSPVVSRDAMKEAYAAGNVGGDERDMTKRIFEKFVESLRLHARAGENVIAEAAFQHTVWATVFVDLREVADARVVICDVNPSIAHARLVDRLSADPRRRFHDDATIGREMIDAYRPPVLDLPTLEVDSTYGYRPSLAEIVAFARGGLRP